MHVTSLQGFHYKIVKMQVINDLQVAHVCHLGECCVADTRQSVPLKLPV